MYDLEKNHSNVIRVFRDEEKEEKQKRFSKRYTKQTTNRNHHVIDLTYTTSLSIRILNETRIS